MGKILLFISLAVIFATAVLGFINRGTYFETKTTLADTEQTLGQTKQALATEEANLKSKVEELTTVTSERDQAISKAEAEETAKNQAKQQVEDLQKQITQKEDEIKQVGENLATAQARITELEAAQTSGGTTEPSSDVAAELAEKTALVEKLQGDLDASRQQLTDLRKKEADRQALKMRDGLQGRVLAVNQAWNFVVLNLGDKNGVVNNAEMLVKRGNSLIGKVRITSVEPATSIADVIPSSVPQGVSIAPGDNVIFQSAQE